MTRSFRSILFSLGALALLIAPCALNAQVTYQLTSFDVPGSPDTFAEGINNSGVVVGGISRDGFNNDAAGFLKSGDTYTTFYVPNSPYGALWDINDAGTATGDY